MTTEKSDPRADLQEWLGWVSAAEIAAWLHISERTIQRMVASGTIPSITIGKYRKFHKASVWNAIQGASDTRKGLRKGDLNLRSLVGQ